MTQSQATLHWLHSAFKKAKRAKTDIYVVFNYAGVRFSRTKPFVFNTLGSQYWRVDQTGNVFQVCGDDDPVTFATVRNEYHRHTFAA